MKFIAHRGLHDYYKPNTYEALKLALEQNYILGIEFDVRITKDKKIVIIHDPIINFVSDGSGIVKKMTYRKLLKYNFGSKKNPSKIMLLDDFLRSITTDKIILIDIKEETDNYIDIANEVIKIIKKHNLNIYICSFNYDLISYLKDNNVGLLIGLSINTKRLYNHFSFNIVQYQYQNRINKKKTTFLWGINSLDDFKKIINQNVYVIVDNFKEIYSLIDEHSLK